MTKRKQTRKKKTTAAPVVHSVELVPVDELRAHPSNYREHPEDQREHLVESIREHGFYRNVAVARDGTILAGHGVVEAARAAGLSSIPVVRFDLEADDPRALKILAGDNEIARLADVDDRALSDLLRHIRDEDVSGLLGTGFDDEKLTTLVLVTRPEAEIGDRQDAAAWVGLPGFESTERPLQLIVAFENENDRSAFMKLVGVEVVMKRTRGTWSIWWPEKKPEFGRMARERFVEKDGA